MTVLNFENKEKGLMEEEGGSRDDAYAMYVSEIERGSAERKEKALGVLSATAICGCDLMASVLYTTGLVISRAGKLAPLCMVCVAFVLWLFRCEGGKMREGGAGD